MESCVFTLSVSTFTQALMFFSGSVCLLLYYRFYQEPASNSLLCQLPTLFSRRDQQGQSSVEIQVANVENCDPQTFSDSKLALGDSVVIYEEPFMEDIDNVHKWIQEASNQSVSCCPIILILL